MAVSNERNDLEKELHEVKQALRRLDASEARGHEYTEEHEKLEQKRKSILDKLSAFESSPG
jgi:hypothetical protein